ncbi:hypothetical protein G5I_02071 [Acromyrmex echinatior]|uniref:Uncharacterized protein n=1 Tax=Acromyrmex echinatior TaxID=103372 RepID=F4W9C3_ACREC|nr:hypothetical protein G5I_02071 [Acromyrmex echinatior]
MLEVCVEQAANTRKDEGPYSVYRSATYARRCALVERMCCICGSDRRGAHVENTTTTTTTTIRLGFGRCRGTLPRARPRYNNICALGISFACRALTRAPRRVAQEEGEYVTKPSMRAGEADRLLAKLRAFMFAQGPQAPLVGACSGARLPYHRRAAPPGSEATAASNSKQEQEQQQRQRRW